MLYRLIYSLSFQKLISTQRYTATRMIMDSASITITKPIRKSKILAALDAEAPNWLTETSHHTTPSGLSSHPEPRIEHPVVQPTPSGVFSKPVIKTKVPSIAIRGGTNDVENNPIECANSEMTIGATKPKAQSRVVYSYNQYRPSPAVVYTQHEEEANDLVQALKGPLGFDLEWLANFRRGKKPTERRTALVQISDAHMILLIQVSSMKKFPQKVKEVIEDKDIIKLGANIRNDGEKLFRDFGLLPAGLVELGTLAQLVDPSFKETYNRSIVALAKVVEYYTHKTLDKNKARTSNWEARLSQVQIAYAANDAHCALTVHNVLMAMLAEQEREVDWKLCAVDLAQAYRDKCAANTTAAPVSTISSQATIVTSSAREVPEGSTALSTTSSTAPQPEHRVWNPFSRQTSLGSVSSSQTVQRELPRPQHLRAYNLWHRRNMPLADICAALRSKENPLAESTVISYVVRALQADPNLSFDMERLKAFVRLEAGSWRRHRDWILEKEGYKKG